MTRTWKRIVFTFAATVALILSSSCNGNEPASPPAPSGPVSTSAPATSQPSTVPSTPSGPPGHTTRTPAPASQWSTHAVTVVHQPAVPPVPVVVRVRYASHPQEGYDRMVFDIRGALPGYTVRYVNEVRADTSDHPVTVPGRRFLLIVMTPAQAHDDHGSATMHGVHRLTLPMMRGYAVVGDNEGYVSIAIGLDDIVGFRVGELPGRIYVDVAA
jgi:hypothetical protein